MTLLLLLLAAYGITFGLVNEKVAALNNLLYRVPLNRDLDQGTNFFSKMFACCYCTGFHAGWVTWLLWRLGGGEDFGLGGVSGGILFAFASGAFSFAFDSLLQRLEQ